MALLKNIEWKDNSNNVIVHKFDLKDDYISKGSVLTVRDGQNVVFATQGKMADVFLPGYYKLDTKSIPVLTKLMSWKYGFQNPFRSDVYFVSTKQFTNQKWGTPNPITIRDKEYGAVRVRGFGSYSFRVKDAYVFLSELSGSGHSFVTQDITDHLRSVLISGITDAIGESNLSVLDFAANLDELGTRVKEGLNEHFKSLGLELVKFTIENLSLPEELEKALDKNTALMMRRNTTDVEMRLAQADALREAAKNPGMAGSMIGAGMGMGMGANMGRMFAQMGETEMTNANAGSKFCSQCGASVGAKVKFCPDCGAKMASQGNTCSKCGAAVKAGSKFCPECGNKL
ncbi:MAG: SPFH domain-containing protein [Clostridia bacterium]|nr:SPFH domain-containing protein [Clostridia bacterium]